MGKNHRVIGDFVPGVNAPEDVKELSKAYLNPARTHQVEIIVKRSNEIQQTLTYVKYRLFLAGVPGLGIITYG